MYKTYLKSMLYIVSGILLGYVSSQAIYNFVEKVTKTRNTKSYIYSLLTIIFYGIAIITLRKYMNNKYTSGINTFLIMHLIAYTNFIFGMRIK